MGKKNKKVCAVSNYFYHLFILAILFYVLISALFGILIKIASSAVVLKIWATTAWNKKYKSVTNKKRKEHYKIALIAKTKLIRLEILISRALINSHISHDEFFSVNNVLREYGDMKQSKT